MAEDSSRLVWDTQEQVVEAARKALTHVDVVTAQKPSGKFVIARQATEHEEFDTYNRAGEFEQRSIVEPGYWVVTACDADGNAFMASDEHGVEHTNTWFNKPDAFEERYGAENVGPDGVVEAKTIPQQFVCLDESMGIPADGVSIRQSWGQLEHMSQGAWLNVTKIDSGEVYGIDPVYFAENFEVLGIEHPTPAVIAPTIGVSVEQRDAISDALDASAMTSESDPQQKPSDGLDDHDLQVNEEEAGFGE